MKESLDEQPSVRSEVVSLGRNLASDPGYPSPPVVRKLAELLVSQPEESDAGGESEKD